ncbi:MAG TPA: DUF3631 domain-containing protein, partial [Phycisphaerae bacterium]|nr:DUF3631 domain-containing protein [Phycisphaerae bacterium]
DWPDRARAAFTALADQRDQDAQDIGVMLLTDIRRIFTEQRIERILSTRLVHTLNAMADRPWSELHNGQPINQAWLAIKLRAFDILPRPMRVKENIVRGYFLTAFSEAFERYLEPLAK